MQLRKKKTKSGDWVVVNDDNNAHAHFRSKFGANVIIHLLKNNIEPINPYFQESKRRLTQDLKSLHSPGQRRKLCTRVSLKGNARNL